MNITFSCLFVLFLEWRKPFRKQKARLFRRASLFSKFALLIDIHVVNLNIERQTWSCCIAYDPQDKLSGLAWIKRIGA